MTKDYYYKNYLYFYCRRSKMWVIDTGDDYIYCYTKQEAIEYIDCLTKEVND